MLFQTLDNLRQKPKAVRNQYALGFALTLTLIIGGVWSLSLPARFANLGNVAAVGSASSTMETAPFSGLLDQLKHQFQSAKDVMQTVPQASSTETTGTNVSTTTQMETEAALNLQINDENRARLEQTSSSHSTPAASSGQTILIATTSATTTESN